MPTGLTPKQEAFIRAFLRTGNASEAYREAYNAKKSKASTVNRAAKALLDHAKIGPRVRAAQKRALERAELSLADHLKELANLRNGAVKEGQFSAAVTAEVARGKAAGLHVEKHEHELGPSFEELVRGSLKPPGDST